MSETQGESPPPSPTPPEPNGEEPPATGRRGIAEPAPRKPRPVTPFAWLAALLLVVIAGVATAPFWAPPVSRVLPWSSPPASRSLAPLQARVAALEQRPPPPAPDLGGIETALKSLSGRIARLETDAAARQPAVTPAQLDRLDQRLGRVESAITANAAGAHQALARLDKQTEALGGRLTTVERRQAAATAAGHKEAALVIALLQMREAIDRGRPFDAGYRAFATLAAGRPKLLAAAAPLADMAPHGVASEAALATQLHRIAGKVATAKAPPAASDWEAATLDRLRSLVRIRRIGGAAPGSADKAVADAERTLAGGDLAGAATALRDLSGAPAAAAVDWLKAAQARLAAVAALDKAQQMVAQQATAAPVPPHPSPATAPAAKATPPS